MVSSQCESRCLRQGHLLLSEFHALRFNDCRLLSLSRWSLAHACQLGSRFNAEIVKVKRWPPLTQAVASLEVIVAKLLHCFLLGVQRIVRRRRCMAGVQRVGYVFPVLGQNGSQIFHVNLEELPFRI